MHLMMIREESIKHKNSGSDSPKSEDQDCNVDEEEYILKSLQSQASHL
jgi:hypothetical protein